MVNHALMKAPALDSAYHLTPKVHSSHHWFRLNLHLAYSLCGRHMPHKVRISIGYPQGKSIANIDDCPPPIVSGQPLRTNTSCRTDNGDLLVSPGRHAPGRQTPVGYMTLDKGAKLTSSSLSSLLFTVLFHTRGGGSETVIST